MQSQRLVMEAHRRLTSNSNYLEILPRRTSRIISHLPSFSVVPVSLLARRIPASTNRTTLGSEPALRHLRPSP